MTKDIRKRSKELQAYIDDEAARTDLRVFDKIHIVIDLTITCDWYFNIYDLTDKRNAEFDNYNNKDLYPSYEKALSEALKEARKIKRLREK